MADFRDLDVCDRKDSAEFGFLNVLGVTVATNGYHGGDSGHGGRTYVSIENIADSDFDAKVSRSESGEVKVELMFGGDSELDTLIQSLRWAADTLDTFAKSSSN